MPKKQALPRQSIVKDVSEALREIDRIGIKKRKENKKGKVKKRTGKAHSFTQKRHDQSACMNFVKWAREHAGVKRLNHIKEKHVRAYLAFKQAEGVSVKHMQNIETSLRHLQNASTAYFKRFEREIMPFMPESRIVKQEGRQAAQNRSYTAKEIEAVKRGVSDTVRKAVELMHGLGLRSSEALSIRREHFVQDKTGAWRVKIGKREGITKGGRPREIPVREAFVPTLETLLREKNPTDRIVTLHDRTVRRGISAALKKAEIEQNRRGCHGFRHAYARERVQELLEDKGLRDKGADMMSRCLHNYTAGRKANYGIHSNADRQLYNQVKEVIDAVHSELGHGQDRWDLAAVYMRD